MKMEKYQKHPKMTKPNIGNFGRNEWAIMGTNCNAIQQLAQQLNHFFFVGVPSKNKKYKTAYIDADHFHRNSSEKADDADESLPYFLKYTDKINFNRFDFKAQIMPFQYKTLFNETDIVLINGNHFQGKRQIVVLDEKKFESLSRKLDRLTQVDAFLSLNMAHPDASGTEGVVLPDFLKSHLKNWAEIPVFSINDVEKIAHHLIANISIPTIKGLILAGGRSTRMGTDKGKIDYHGKPQRDFIAEILMAHPDKVGRGLNIEPHFSIRAEQAAEFPENQKVIADTFLELGPFGAILSAFRHDPNAAWLVVACDLPLLDAEALKYLIENRNPNKIATTFRSPESAEGFPEPLITIWEPKSYAILLQFMAQGISCPRKVLINSDVLVLDAPLPHALMNVNTLEEKEKAINYLSRGVV